MPCTFEVNVVPSSGRCAWVLTTSGRLKCFVKSPPEDGKANAELLRMLAKALGLSTQDLEIIAGATARKKLLRVHAAFTYADILKKLGVAQQSTLIS